MCLSCQCGRPTDDHGDARALTMLILQGAADFSGISVHQVLENIIDSLPSAGASKSAGADLATCRVVKAESESRYTLGVAYPAMRPDVTIAADGHRDFVGPDVLEKTAWAWMSQHRDVNLFHQGGTSGHAQVVESYIYRGPDWTVSSPVDGLPYVVKSGDWLLGTIWDTYGWDLVKAGLVRGWSPEGGARRSIPTPERVAQLRSASNG